LSICGGDCGGGDVCGSGYVGGAFDCGCCVYSGGYGCDDDGYGGGGGGDCVVSSCGGRGFSVGGRYVCFTSTLGISIPILYLVHY